MNQFGKSLKSMREGLQISQEELGEGICTGSEISKIEANEREACFLLQCVLLARLGISPGNYTNLVFKEEYERWSERNAIYEAVSDALYDDASKLIEFYRENRIGHSLRELPTSKKLELQLCEALNVLLLRGQGAPEAEILEHCQKAMRCTMRHLLDTEVLPSNQLLTAREFDIFLEYRHTLAMMAADSKDMTDCYDALLDWVLQDKNPSRIKAFFAPKIAVYYAEYLNKSGLVNKRNRKLAEIGCSALDILSKTCRNYFLLEMCEDFLLLNAEGKAVIEEKYDIGIIRNISKGLKELCEKYGISAYNKACPHVYREPNVFFVGDAISRRRKMLGIKAEDLCEGVCDIRVLQRLVSGKKRTQSAIIKSIMRKLKLIPALSYYELETTKKEAFDLYNDIAKDLNARKYKDACRRICRLKELIPMDSNPNRQAIAFFESTAEYGEGRISQTEYFEKTEEALEYTVDITALYNAKDFFMTSRELTCIKQLCELSEEACSQYLPFVEKFLLHLEETGSAEYYFAIYAFLDELICGKDDEKGRYDESIKKRSNLVKLCLAERNLRLLNKNRYNLDRIINIKENTPESKKAFIESCKFGLNASKFCSRKWDEQFYTNVLNNQD